MHKPKLLFITHYSAMYGANKSMYTLIKALLTKDISVLVFSKEIGEINDCLTEIGISSICVDFKLDVYKRKKSLIERIRLKIALNKWNEKLIKSYCKIVTENKITHVVSNSVAFDFGYELSKHLKLKHVQIVREYGLQDYAFKPLFKRNLFHRLHKSYTSLYISKSLFHHYKLNFKVPLNDRVRIKYDGIYEKLPVVQDLQVKASISKYKIVIFGLISNEKGQLDALKAFYKFQQIVVDSELHIIGDGDTTLLMQFVDQYNISKKIVFHGYRNDVEVILHHFDLCLVCSRCEALGRVTIEAMANNVLVIGRNSCGTAELIDEEINGFKYDGTVEDLVEVMVKVHNQDNSTIISNARKFVENTFNVNSYADFFIKEVLNHGLF